MTDIKLPLDPLVLSIGVNEEPGPVPEGKATVLELGYNRLSVEMLRQIAPDKVMSWLFCARYDAYDIAELLTLAGFQGPYFAAAARLPRKGIVTREMKLRFPGLDFRLICPAQLSGGASEYHQVIAGAMVAGTPARMPALV